MGGSLGPKQAKKGEPHEDSWYARLEPVFDTPPLEDDLWGARREWGVRADPLVGDDGKGEGAAAALVILPDWATQPIGDEPRPPRPLAPSNAGEEQGADPPLPADALSVAARRGTLIHRLLERLPDLAAEDRRGVAEAWLARQAGDLNPTVRREMLDSALGVLAECAFAEIFGPGALAEVPFSAVVDGQVIAGTADRLLITEEAVTVIDFKTTRRPPESLADIPQGTLRQMAAYAAALSVIYPGRTVRTGVLYTHTPTLIAIPDEVLVKHKAKLSAAQDNYEPLPLE